MTSKEYVEVKLVYKGDYSDPQLKSKLNEITRKLKTILHTGQQRFALKTIQPWNSVKITVDISKEAADRLRLLAIEGNTQLIELGILSVEINGQTNEIKIESNKSSIKTTKNEDLLSSKNVNTDDHTSERIKTENSNDSAIDIGSNSNIYNQKSLEKDNLQVNGTYYYSKNDF